MFHSTKLSNQENLELVPGQISNFHDPSHHRKAKPSCRQAIQSNGRSLGLPDPPQNLQTLKSDLGSFPGRSICKPLEHSDLTIVLLETPATGKRDRCPCSSLEQIRELCLSSLESNTQNNKKDKERGMPIMPDNSLLSDSTLVQLTSEPLHRFSYKDNYGSGFLNGRPGTPSSPDHSKQAISNGLEAIRMQARQRGLSLSAAKILENSTREKTSKTYQHKWSAWCNWCHKGRYIHFNPTSLI